MTVHNVDQQPGATEGLVLHTTLLTRVTGYLYPAVARVLPGDPVFLIRDPDNLHDPNAIAVCDIAGRQLGVLPRDLAAEYASLVDHRCVYLSGRLVARDEPDYDPEQAAVNPPLHLSIYVHQGRLDDYFFPPL
jgi:hypothetical protein